MGNAPVTPDSSREFQVVQLAPAVQQQCVASCMPACEPTCVQKVREKPPETGLNFFPHPSQKSNETEYFHLL